MLYSLAKYYCTSAVILLLCAIAFTVFVFGPYLGRPLDVTASLYEVEIYIINLFSFKCAKNVGLLWVVEQQLRPVVTLRHVTCVTKQKFLYF